MKENLSVINKIGDVLSDLASGDALSLHMHMHELCTRLDGNPIGDDALVLSRACYLADRITDADVAAIEAKMEKIREALNGS